MNALLESLRKVLWLLTIICFTGAFAQQTVPAGGGKANGSGGVLSYTVGQMAYKVQADAQTSLTEGIQQPYEISEISGIETSATIHLNFTSYPNPVDDYVTVEIQNYPFKYLHFIIYDSNGKLLVNKKATGTITQIKTNDLVPAVYFMEVMDHNQSIKKFKIIKK